MTYQTIKIPKSHLKRLEIEMDGEHNCCLGSVKINDIEVKKGVVAIELNLIANERPDVTLICNKRHISNEAKQSWGLEDSTNDN